MRGNQQTLLLFGALAAGAYYLWQKSKTTPPPAGAGASGAIVASSGGLLPSYNLAAVTGAGSYNSIFDGPGISSAYYQAISGRIN